MSVETSTALHEPFIPLRVLVEYDKKYKFFVAHCLQTGNVVTADDADTAEEMIKELLGDEVTYAISHNNLKNLFSSPAPMDVWKRWSITAAQNGTKTFKLDIIARELKLDEPDVSEVKVARAAAAA
jgi:hypothetical protein